jgi:hypothetical protein
MSHRTIITWLIGDPLRPKNERFDLSQMCENTRVKPRSVQSTTDPEFTTRAPGKAQPGICFNYSLCGVPSAFTPTSVFFPLLLVMAAS